MMSTEHGREPYHRAETPGRCRDDLFYCKPLPCHPCLLSKPKILTFKLDSF